LLGAALALATAAALLMGLQAGCHRRPEPELRLGNIHWVGDDLIYLARDLGYFGVQPIRLVTYPSTYEIVRAFQNKTIEVAALTSYEVLRMLEHGDGLRVMLLMDVSHGGDALVARRGIGSLQALKARRVGVEFDTFGAYLLARALEAGGLARDDVTMVPADVFEHERALTSGRVDAIVTFEPHRSRLVASGASELYSSRAIPYEISDMLVVREGAWEKHREALTTLASAWGRALAVARKDPEAAADRLAPLAGLTPAQYLAAMRAVTLFDLAENQALLARRDPALMNGLGAMAAAMRRHGMLDRSVDPGPALDDRAVKEALP
jgi:NitT/TauT family transport system substrate-binding protein